MSGTFRFVTDNPKSRTMERCFDMVNTELQRVFHHTASVSVETFDEPEIYNLSHAHSQTGSGIDIQEFIRRQHHDRVALGISNALKNVSVITRPGFVPTERGRVDPFGYSIPDWAEGAVCADRIISDTPIYHRLKQTIVPRLIAFTTTHETGHLLGLRNHCPNDCVMHATPTTEATLLLMKRNHTTTPRFCTSCLTRIRRSN